MVEQMVVGDLRGWGPGLSTGEKCFIQGLMETAVAGGVSTKRPINHMLQGRARASIGCYRERCRVEVGLQSSGITRSSTGAAEPSRSRKGRRTPW